MAEIVLKDSYVEIKTTNLSAKCQSINIDYGAEMLDDTLMGDTGRSRKAGLIDWSATITFIADYSTVDSALFPLVGSTAFAVTFKPDGSSTGANNPQFTGSAVIETYNPITGTVGDLGTNPVTLQGVGVLTRAIA